ncbi:hypothetical protein DFQ28_000675 [Apophysomyces sp. BC1034]|nr:hypothetical protein DFQ29_001179 [Apophysomyces sp. BC1021]KAG0183876.1 hypothetical protein DFQ28_000675 [Apophysomyces sp. BC1034]
METVITKGQAACILLGDIISDDNRRKCKALMEETPLDIVYSPESGNKRPMAIGKVVVQRHPFDYLKYPDTPPHVSSVSVMESDANNDESTMESGMFWDNDYCIPAESTDSMFLHHRSTESTQSSLASDDSVITIKPAKHSILDLVKCISSRDEPKHNKERYEFHYLSQQALFDLLKDHMPNISSYCTARKVNDWISKESTLHRTKNMRQGHLQLKARPAWVLKQEFRENAIETVFNRHAFKQTVRNSPGWTTIGYARKSVSNESTKKRTALLQTMIENLHINDLCEKVYVSPMCSVNSELMIRDYHRSATTTTVLQQLRFQDGDMQDFIVFAKTTTVNIRLVVLDYAGLTTKPDDLRKFVKSIKSIKEIVVDKGHKLECFTRHKLLNSDDIQKSNCRTANVKRSTLC